MENREVADETGAPSTSQFLSLGSGHHANQGSYDSVCSVVLLGVYFSMGQKSRTVGFLGLEAQPAAVRGSPLPFGCFL